MTEATVSRSSALQATLICIQFPMMILSNKYVSAAQVRFLRRPAPFSPSFLEFSEERLAFCVVSLTAFVRKIAEKLFLLFVQVLRHLDNRPEDKVALPAGSCRNNARRRAR